MNVKDIHLSLVIALRDMRGGFRALKLLTAGVFVGAAAVALVGASSDALRQGARSGALEGVGGDISLRLFHAPPSPQQLGVLKSFGDVSVTAELKPMAQTKRSQLIELKGVDDMYPLYGAVTLKPDISLKDALSFANNRHGAVVDETLGLAIGETLRIGTQTFHVRAVLKKEPDRVFRAFSLGPRVMVAKRSLIGTGLVQKGAEVYYYAHIKLKPGQSAAEILKAIDRAFPNAGWRMVNGQEGVPGIERSLSMVHVVLLFIGLGILLIGGSGISAAVRAHISSKINTIAILKSIGTPPSTVALAMGFEVMFAAGTGALMGVALGAFGPMLVAQALSDQVPFVLSSVPSAKPLIAAALFGVLTALLFAWWPLMTVMEVPARVLLRDRFETLSANVGLVGWAGAFGLLTAILVVVFWVSPMAILTTAFLGGAWVLTALYFSLGRLVSLMAKKLAKGQGAWLRMALGNLHRPGSPTAAVVMALGLTLTGLVALDAIAQIAGRHLHQALPNSAPDMVVFSLNADDAVRLRQDLSGWDGIQSLNIKPFLHARVQALKGVPISDLKIPRSLSWVIRGDRGVSYEPHIQTGFSIDAGIAQKLDLGIGDTLTLNVSGTLVKAPITSLRTVDWTGLDLVFPIVGAPATLNHVPHTFAGALKAKPGRALDLEQRLKLNFPEVATIRVSGVLNALSSGLAMLVSGLHVAAMMCGVVALVVLAGSVMQGLQSRTDEALLFKVLGARQSQVLSQVVMEFLCLGVVVSAVAVPLGLGVAYSVARAAGLSDVDVSFTGGLQLAALAITVTVCVGVLVTSEAYRSLPSTYLRRRGA